MNELKELFLLMKDKGLTEDIKKISFLLVKSSKNEEIIKIGQENLSGNIEIDLWELESLINPNKFEFPESNVGEIIVENN